MDRELSLCTPPAVFLLNILMGHFSLAAEYGCPWGFANKSYLWPDSRMFAEAVLLRPGVSVSLIEDSHTQGCCRSAAQGWDTAFPHPSWCLLTITLGLRRPTLNSSVQEILFVTMQSVFFKDEKIDKIFWNSQVRKYVYGNSRIIKCVCNMLDRDVREGRARTGS